MERIKRLLLKMIKLINKPEMLVLPGHLAFFLVLSIVPIITTIGYIASFFSISLDNVINLMSSSLPSEVNEILIPYITGKGADISVLSFTFIGFILASNGAHSIIVTSNQLYELEQSSYLNRRIKAVFLTVLLVLLILFILLVLGFGNKIITLFLKNGFLKGISGYILMIIKWPIALIVVFIIIKILYTVAPDSYIKSKYVNRGALIATIGITFVTAIYSFYVSNFSNYDIFYGGLSNIIILMMWVYIVSFTLVIGIAFNASSYKIESSSKK
ncbi:MAG: YihY/virulence factor BrkB family protein [Bacilli bacterium]|nr:YihY/virulence factor BrkB family protein [Bacilli bacterium]